MLYIPPAAPHPPPTTYVAHPRHRCRSLITMPIDHKRPTNFRKPCFRPTTATCTCTRTRTIITRSHRRWTSPCWRWLDPATITMLCSLCPLPASVLSRRAMRTKWNPMRKQQPCWIRWAIWLQEQERMSGRCNIYSLKLWVYYDGRLLLLHPPPRGQRRSLLNVGRWTGEMHVYILY